jgi:iron complex transport system substrate-binding protein
VDAKRIAERPGWQAISAVKANDIYSIDSADILQPGPAILAGVEQMSGIIEGWRQ